MRLSLLVLHWGLINQARRVTLSGWCTQAATRSCAISTVSAPCAYLHFAKGTFSLADQFITAQASSTSARLCGQPQTGLSWSTRQAVDLIPQDSYMQPRSCRPSNVLEVDVCPGKPNISLIRGPRPSQPGLESINTLPVICAPRHGGGRGVN